MRAGSAGRRRPDSAVLRGGSPDLRAFGPSIMAASVAGGARATEYGGAPIACATEWEAEAAHKLASAYRPSSSCAQRGSCAAARAAPALQFSEARAAASAATHRLASASAMGGGHRPAQGGALRAAQQQQPPHGALLAFTEHSGQASDLPLTRRTPFQQERRTPAAAPSTRCLLLTASYR